MFESSVIPPSDDSLAAKIDALFARRPSLREVAQSLLVEQLAQQLPGRHIDLQEIEVRTAGGLPKRYAYPSQGKLVINGFLSGGPFYFPEGSSLTSSVDRPMNDVEIEDVELAINAASPGLMLGYQQKLLDFWCSQASGDSPWKQLSELLKNDLRAKAETLSIADKETIRQVVDYPDNYQRETVFQEQAAQVDIVEIDPPGSLRHPSGLDGLVITRSVDGELNVLIYSVPGGVESLGPVHLRNTLLRRIRAGGGFGAVSHKPDGHTFDVWVLILLEKSLQEIALIEPRDNSSHRELNDQVKRFTSLDYLTGKVLHKPGVALESPQVRRRQRQLIYQWSSPRGEYSFREREWLAHVSPRHARPRRQVGNAPVASGNNPLLEGLKKYCPSFSNEDLNEVLRGANINAINNNAINICNRTAAPRTKRSLDGVEEHDYVPVLRQAPNGSISPATQAINVGTVLLSQLDSRKKALKKSAGVDPLAPPKRSPADIEDSATADAKQYDAAAFSINRLTAGRLGMNTREQVGKLEAAAQALRILGVSLRVDMARNTLTPSVDALVYLIEKGKADVRKIGVRKASQFDGKPDFIQEYEVHDLEKNRPLWYAHFHYQSLDTAAERFTKAHLKTVAQRTLGREYEEREKKAGRDVKVWRGEINTTAAQRYFLNI